MSFLDELSRASESPAAIWHQFVLAHDSGRDEWYIFVEGSLDMPFYTTALRLVLREHVPIREFRCSGKTGVLTARDDVRRSHPSCGRCLFFVDHDLQGLVPDQMTSIPNDVFCTSVYSVENYLVHEEALNVVWTDLWSLPSSDQRRVKVVEKLRVALRRFHVLVVPVMAWIVLALRSGFRPNVNNVNLASLVSLNDCLPALQRDAYDTLRRSTGCQYTPSLSQWIHETRKLSRANPKLVVRGKFELWFFCRFLEAVFQALRRGDGARPSGAIQMVSESVGRAVIGKIATPDELRLYVAEAALRGGHESCGGI